MDDDEAVLVMLHKRIRKHAGYDLDSQNIFKALNEQGYDMGEQQVIDGLGRLKNLGYLRAFEDQDDFGPDNSSRITRYWGLEITPEGAMKAIDLMNQFRYGN